MGEAALLAGLRRVAQSPRRFRFEGFHAHLGGYGVASRIAAMVELMRLVAPASDLGLSVRVVDIGGGLPIRYVAPGPYAAVLEAQRPHHYRTGSVPPDFYPYGSETTAADWLEALLDAPCGQSGVAASLRGAGLRLALEPGRSLVDQAAISVFRIIRVKPLGDGTAVVFVEGSSFSACETWFRSEFLVDPILVRARPAAATGPLRAYVAGHSCLGDAVVTNRWLDFAAAPASGDLLIYANTAGYQMDLLENEFHRHPMPVRLAAHRSPAGDTVFVKDK